VTRDHTPDSNEPLVGDADGVAIYEGDEFDYELSRPETESVGFDAVEVADLREMLDHVQGHG
jgi:hypothetical protein